MHRITAPCSLLALARSLSHASLPSLHFASSLQLEKVKSPAWGCFSYITTLIVTLLVWFLNLFLYCWLPQCCSCWICCLWPIDAAFFGCFLGDIRRRVSKESSAIFRQDIKFIINPSDIGTSHSQVRGHYGIGADDGFGDCAGDCLAAGFCRACIVVQIATQIRGMQPQPGPHNQMNACSRGSC